MRDFTGNKPIKPLRTHLWGRSGDILSLIVTIMPPPKPAKTHLRNLVGSSSNISFKIKELHLAMGMIGFFGWGTEEDALFKSESTEWPIWMGITTLAATH